MKKIAITTGDPAGIGIELTSRIVRFFPLPKRLIIIVYGSIDQYPDGNMVRQITSPAEAISPGKIYWIRIEDPRIKPGKPSSLSGKIALEILSRCAADLKSGDLDGVVTCPVSKEFIRQTKKDFIGHTEFFADTANNPEVVMSFWSDKFILALLTTHLAICDLHQILTPELIESRIRLIFAEISKLRPGQHRFACLGVNPHAGEQGAFGAEDRMIGEILKKLAREDINIDGPFPADTFFAYHAGEYDVVISAYHDQGLIPFKMLNRDEGVNVTLGLPFIRTSVDHGTAFDLAGTGKASDKSLLKALNLAMEMVGLKSPKTPVYDNFAPFYDHYMAHVNYQSWIKIILQHYNKRFKKTPAEILELACGTCNISCLLVKKGMSVDAWDNSSEMLKIASRKPFAPNLYCRSLKDRIPAENYDLILLIFDSLNYLINTKDISKLLENAYHGLKKRGMFIFDITTLKNCLDNFDGFVNLEDKNNEYLIHQSELDQSNLIQKTRLTFFRKSGYIYKRNDEIHRQKIHLVRDLLPLIKASPFQLNGIYSQDCQENLLYQYPESLDNNYLRLFFILEKNAVSE